jgi:hypothetical protein
MMPTIMTSFSRTGLKVVDGMWHFVRQILKAAAIFAGIFAALVFVPNLFSVFAFLKSSQWNNSLTALLLVTALIYLAFFISFILLFSIAGLIAIWWRKSHPHKPLKTTMVSPPELSVQSSATQTEQPPVISLPSFSNALTWSLGILSGLLYALYFVGRTYIENYYAQFGIPSYYISYAQHDYIYFGAQIDTLLISGAYMLILVGFLRYWLHQPVRELSYGKWDLVFAISYLILFSIVFVFVVIIDLFNTNLANEPGMIMASIISAVVVAGIQVMITYFDRGILNRIKVGSVISVFFMITVSISLLWFPFVTAKAWGLLMGHFKASTITEIYPKVDLEVSTKITDAINWTPTNHSSYKNSDTLYLILKNDKYMFLKKTAVPRDIIILNTENVLSTTVYASDNVSK